MRILVADDHAIIRKGLIQLLLYEYPFAIVEEAGDAGELLKKVGHSKWDLVICDINMPGRSGIEALQQIKLLSPGLPVLIMSMYPEEQYALRAFKAGASGYLTKESIHIDLINAIQQVVNGKKFITPSIAEKMANSFDIKIEKPPHENLSNREFEVFRLLVSGKSASTIAEQLSISITTVSTYRSRILEKMGMKSNADMIRYAIEKEIG